MLFDQNGIVEKDAWNKQKWIAEKIIAMIPKIRCTYHTVVFHHGTRDDLYKDWDHF